MVREIYTAQPRLEAVIPSALRGRCSNCPRQQAEGGPRPYCIPLGTTKVVRMDSSRTAADLRCCWQPVRHNGWRWHGRRRKGVRVVAPSRWRLGGNGALELWG